MSRLAKNALEWSVFTVALLLVLATVGYLVREALTTSAVPPDVVVTLGEGRAAAGGHNLRVLAENRGGETAEDLRITVVLEGGGSREEATLVIPYLPRQARRGGWVVFQGDPTRGRLRIGGVAYQTP